MRLTIYTNAVGYNEEFDGLKDAKDGFSAFKNWLLGFATIGDEITECEGHLTDDSGEEVAHYLATYGRRWKIKWLTDAEWEQRCKEYEEWEKSQSQEG